MTDTTPLGLIVVRLKVPVKNMPVGTELGYKDVPDAIAALGSAAFFDVVRDQQGNPIPPLTPEEIEEAQRAAQRRAKSRRLILGADFDPLWNRVEGIPSAEELTDMQAAVDAVADVPPRVEAVETAVGRVDPGATGSLGTVLAWDGDGTPRLDAISVSPMMFGAKGDGVTDDTAAVKRWRDYAITHPTGISSPRTRILDGRGREYIVSDTIEFKDIWYLTLQNVRFKARGTFTDVVRFLGVSFSTVENVTISADGGDAGGTTADYALRWDTNQPAGGAIASRNTLRNVSVMDLRAKTGIGLGTQSANLQCDQFRLFGCYVTGKFDVAAPDATYYQTGIQCGSGTHGNVLLYHLYGCFSMGYRYNLFANATDVSWYGGIMQNAEANVRHYGTDNLKVDGVRSENSQRFFLSSAITNSTPAITLANIEFATNMIHSDGNWVYFTNRGSLTLQDVRVRKAGGTITPKVAMYHSAGGKVLHISGMVTDTPIQNCFVFNGSLQGTIQNFTYLNTDGSVNSHYGGPYIIGSGEIGFIQAGVAPDVSLSRSAANTLSLGANDALRVGRDTTANRPNATTVGVGAMFYDTTLGKPIWSDGTAWRDAAGTVV